ncbi:MAG: hypothetical protein HOC23_11930 [Halieaceae bacterium]|jgi:hypothetical protein|nr:hypothetical protein [Halieaceae bacterium]
MADSISWLGIVTAVILPWLLGFVWVHFLLNRSGRCNLFIAAGQGYLAGLFIITLIIRGWDKLGLPLHFWGIAAFTGGLCIIGFVAIRRRAPVSGVAPISNPLQWWQIAVTALLLLLIVIRFTTLGQELVLRPLFPWDAWMNWAPKAIVWYHHQELVPFVSPDVWPNVKGSSLSYVDGTSGGWNYPAGVPLIQLWIMLGLGASDHTLIYLPWLLVTPALGLALYGHLRLHGVSIPLAVFGCYALLNLPYVNVHIALAGYADIWVMAAFGCSVFALHTWNELRHWPYAALALVMAFMCTHLKVPGLIMGAIVVLIFLSTLITPSRKATLLLASVGGMGAIYILLVGIDVVVPVLGQIVLSSNTIILPYIGHYVLEYHPIHSAVLNTLFGLLNWNLLWYLLVALLVVKAGRGHITRAPSPELLALTGTLLFLFLVYYFTPRYVWAVDYSQLSRALLYAIPVIVFYVCRSSTSRNKATK